MEKSPETKHTPILLEPVKKQYGTTTRQLNGNITTLEMRPEAIDILIVSVGALPAQIKLVAEDVRRSFNVHKELVSFAENMRHRLYAAELEQLDSLLIKARGGDHA